MRTMRFVTLSSSSIIRVMTYTLLLSALSCTLGYAAEIDRKTFSMSLPKGWTEDKKDDMYDPDSFVFFENSESCLFAVIVGKKSAGASVDNLLNHQKQAWQKKVTDAKSTELKRWSKYEGKGYEIEGKAQGIFRSRARIFGFENDHHVCIIMELATPGDFRTFADDFEKIRQTFKLK